MARRQAGRAYQEFKAKVRQLHAVQGRPCALCHQPIDYRLRYPHPACWSLDHRTSLYAGGAEFDPANVQASHLRCNQSKGGKDGNRMQRLRRAIRETPHTSVRW